MTTEKKEAQPKSAKERQAKRRAYLLACERDFKDLVEKLTEIEKEAFKKGEYRDGFFKIAELLTDIKAWNPLSN